MRSLDLGLYKLSTNEKFVVGGVGGWGRLGVIIESNLNRVRLSCCWVGVGLVLGWVVTIAEFPKLSPCLRQPTPLNTMTLRQLFLQEIV